MSDPNSTSSALNPALSALKSSAPASTTSGPSTAASSPAPVFNTTSYELNAKVSLADLCAKGTSHYAHKQYEDAAEYFARAAELQAEVNGEMSTENGEVLFLYGRSLFRLGQSNSDVLGGNGGAKSKKAGKKEKFVKAERKGEDKETVTEAGVAIMAEGVDKAEKEIKEDGVEHVVDAPKKPLFQFTGDDNFEDSDDEDEEEAEGEEEEEEDDELGTAFEVLDLARVLFTRKLDTILSETTSNGAAESKDKGKGKSVESKPSGSDTPAEAAEDTPLTRHIKERLADTHDLLAEISLENERFPNAVADFKESLKYKQKLYPFFSEIIAEAHYKLSLALEFASITTTQEAAAATADAADGEKVEAQIDEAMREEAAVELEKAIQSTEGKLKEKELEVAETNIAEENDVTRKQIVEVKEIIADMKQRLKDLRAPPIDLNAALSGPSSGIIGATLGESPAEAAKRIEEAKAGAKDLSSMVRKKEKKVESPKAAEPAVSTGKRKAEDVGEGEAKKVKTDA